MGEEQEATLEQWMSRLPTQHLAYREYEQLRKDSTRLDALLKPPFAVSIVEYSQHEKLGRLSHYRSIHTHAAIDEVLGKEGEDEG